MEVLIDIDSSSFKNKLTERLQVGGKFLRAIVWDIAKAEMEKIIRASIPDTDIVAVRFRHGDQNVVRVRPPHRLLSGMEYSYFQFSFT